MTLAILILGFVTLQRLGELVLAQRNTALVYGVAAAFIALVGGVIGTTLGMLRARAAEPGALREVRAYQR